MCLITDEGNLPRKTAEDITVYKILGKNYFEDFYRSYYRHYFRWQIGKTYQQNLGIAKVNAVPNPYIAVDEGFHAYHMKLEHAKEHFHAIPWFKSLFLSGAVVIAKFTIPKGSTVIKERDEIVSNQIRFDEVVG